MSARGNKKRISHLFHGRFYGQFIWRSAEDIAWERMAPHGMEFGSPDFERLMQEDQGKWDDVFSPPALSVQERDSVTRLKGMFAGPKGKMVSVEDMNPLKRCHGAP